MKVNGAIVPHQLMDPVTMLPTPIDVNTASCGANLYRGVLNYLQFFLTPGCTAYVIPRDAILTSIRLEWTAAEFFAGDGATTFTQRLGAVLGIDVTRIKIVSVYEGSVNVDVQIMGDEADIQTNENQSVTSTATAYQDLTTIQSTLNAQLGADASVLGAPVLEIQGLMSSNYQPALVVVPILYDYFGQPIYTVPASTGALANFAVGISALLCAVFASVF